MTGLLTLALAIVAGLWSVADGQAALARRTMDSWTAGDGVLTLGAWQQVRDRLERAVHLNPLSADYLMNLGAAYEWRARFHGFGSRTAVEYQSVATNLYRWTAQQRPSWGLAWASLAQSKVLALGRELDRETYAAVDKALIFGPWEPEVQKKVAWVGMYAWDRFSAAMQERIRAVIVRGLGNHPYYRTIIKMAVDLRWEGHLGPLLFNDDQRSRLLHRLTQRDDA